MYNTTQLSTQYYHKGRYRGIYKCGLSYISVAYSVKNLRRLAVSTGHIHLKWFDYHVK